MKEVRVSARTEGTEKRPRRLEQQLAEPEAEYDQQRQFEAEFDKQMKALEKEIEDGRAEVLRFFQRTISNLEDTFTRHIEVKLDETFG